MKKDNPLLIHNSNDHRILVSLFRFRPYSLLSFTLSEACIAGSENVKSFR
jgi:hypothetical protein